LSLTGFRLSAYAVRTNTSTCKTGGTARRAAPRLWHFLQTAHMLYTFHTYSDFQRSYAGESDRSVVILASSFIERALENYILKKLVDDAFVKKLFEGYAPLATLSAKIEVAFALGLLPRHVHSDLRIIKRVRNVFAHEPESYTFSSKRIVDLCASLSKIRKSDGTERVADSPRVSARREALSRRNGRSAPANAPVAPARNTFESRRARSSSRSFFM